MKNACIARMNRRTFCSLLLKLPVASEWAVLPIRRKWKLQQSGFAYFPFREKKNYIFEAVSGITDRCSYLEKICIWQVVFHRKGGSLAWEISVFSMSSFSVMSRGNQDCQMTLWKRLLDTELAPRRDASLVSCFVWKNIRIWKSSLSRTSLSLTGLKHFFAEVNIFQAQTDFLPREKFSCLAECATIH